MKPALLLAFALAATVLRAADARLTNLSTRALVGTGASALTVGFVIGPGAAKPVLVRAVGPTLATFGLTGALADPVLTLFNSASVVVAANDNWLAADAAAMAAVGAFALPAGSRDAALVTTLAPGNYTAQVTGTNATTGLALVEVYDLTGITFATAETTTPTGDLDYVATAATGEKIAHPLSAKLVAVTVGNTTVQLPENLVYVPAGSFTFGTGTTATTKTLDAYAIGKFAVTNAEWKTFLDATGSRTYPAHWSNGTFPAGKAAHPVLYISLTSANAYCTWISQKTGRAVMVPSAEQWEKAARGPAATLFPWGNTLDAAYNAATGVLTAKCNFNAVVAADYLFNHANDAVTYNDSHSKYFGVTTTIAKIAGYASTGAATPFAITATGNVNGWVDHDTYTGFIYTDVFDRINALGGTTTAVGTYAAGKSTYGCYDMSGNVWQWTSTLMTATNGAEAGQLVNEVRGGSWYATGNSCRAIGIGEGRSATGNYNTIGFRIAQKL